MAKFDTSNLAEFMVDMKDLANLPNSVIADMLDSEADVIMPAQKKMAQSMGVYDTGQLANSITKGKVTTSSSGSSLSLTFSGSRKRGNTTTRNAEIAFVNEFGKHGQPARPFIQTANEQNIDKAVDKAADVYDKYLKSKNL